jgi:hypothetical protein
VPLRGLFFNGFFALNFPDAGVESNLPQNPSPLAGISIRPFDQSLFVHIIDGRGNAEIHPISVKA